MKRSQKKLVEGIDYTVESGLMVLSKKFLLERGYCCRSGCRNCPYGFKKQAVISSSPRIISLVPSWTETLIEAGLNVVGRTDYCIHPKGKVEGIKSLGGTKKIDAELFNDLNPDYIVLDREENTAEMAEAAAARAFITHITHINDVGPILGRMAKEFSSQKLLEFATRWERVSHAARIKVKDLSEFPGVLEWVKEPEARIETVLYIIWKRPLMTVSADTFIGSLLAKLGLEERLQTFETRYPEFDLSKYDKQKTLLLFSSEPYPFLKERNFIVSLGFPAALVDGEKFSWFGIRSLEFLEGELLTF